MNGAESLLETLEHNGIDVCFANPGTSEMHFVAALDRSPGVRGVLGLFEGVVTGAADGYARMTDRPAATLLHLGPGMANGLSSMHNALRARSSMVNIIGDHAGYHRALNAPLTSDIEGAARPFSHWVRTSPSANTIAQDAADAIGVSRPGRIASLILPADTAWSTAAAYTTPPTAQPLPEIAIDECVIEAAARNLRINGKRTAILLGGRALRAEQLALAGKIAQATGATLLSDTFAPRTERGAGRHATMRVPYPVDAAQQLLSRFDALVIVDSKAPVAFFAYPDKSSVLTAAGTTFYEVSKPEADSVAALEALCSAVLGEGAAAAPSTPSRLAPPALPTGTITADKLAAWLGSAIPENGIVLDESVTTGRSFFEATMNAQPHDYFTPTGGAIGWALPLAAGAAIACPDRKVIALESDGSGMYMPQALWTMAREGLDVVSLIFANRKYQILRNEMHNVGVHDFGAKAESLLDIGSPVIDWVAVSQGMGVPAQRVETIEELSKAFEAALSDSGPRLIEVVL
ncbi:acetolactate synthase large subunit [Brevibacterium daeguense]|uniref:Acetolactate synthase large subunit n=1 Tax=Brevibacterium daeguense TaxID=909936 RepID=A0ABP8EJV2_9MICO